MHAKCFVVCVEWLAELPFLVDWSGIPYSIRKSGYTGAQRTHTSGNADAGASATTDWEYESQHVSILRLRPASCGAAQKLFGTKIWELCSEERGFQSLDVGSLTKTSAGAIYPGWTEGWGLGGGLAVAQAVNCKVSEGGWTLWLGPQSRLTGFGSDGGSWCKLRFLHAPPLGTPFTLSRRGRSRRMRSSPRATEKAPAYRRGRGRQRACMRRAGIAKPYDERVPCRRSQGMARRRCWRRRTADGAAANRGVRISKSRAKRRHEVAHFRTEGRTPDRSFLGATGRPRLLVQSPFPRREGSESYHGLIPAPPTESHANETLLKACAACIS
ncbi:hypothetical protein EK21DRAFT_86499 [Setomelanomma holmii]|uniref:Uncharacterized protein n=1 Tax=Setomelanomma holmii TaxID=210430 RepID=A0A9P4LRR9_9PLEO|nr:hypothetical protein EK21DRAFT_86499 [Setomelanomma holmii]